MTTPTRRHRRSRPDAFTAAAPARPARPAVPARPGGGGCCRTWSSEHRTPGGTVVRTTWHEPACKTGGRL
ncbi:hypothetical protein ACFV1W_28905 [Kitasatospora sp. NPDC059648]|uniref:hypothetical protein n=1 Tax=Kitasatospora sp. NPDC059648 TaxID=3346894 RepID=UPI0036CCA763